MSDSPTQLLEDEHLVIAKVVGAAPVLADRLEAGQAVDADTLQEVVEFMRLFADRCHHGKEEELLFPLLVKKGVPTEGCPIGALTMEHVKGRMLVKGLADALEAYRKGDSEGKQAVIQSLRGIAELYPNHIWKEDYLLFPMTNKVLNSEVLQSLLQQFEQVDEQIGRDMYYFQEQFADRLSESIQAG
jgi:hemerythrin-like domain-containing protein